MNHFSELFNKLSINVSNGLYITQENLWVNILPAKIEQTLVKLSPYAFFVFNNQPLILFFDSDRNNSETHTLCWNFNVTPVIFFVSITDVLIYNGFTLTRPSSESPILKKLARQDELHNFSYHNLISGNLFKDYKKAFHIKNRVDKKLLANIGVARESLIGQDLPTHIANSLIGRLIFVRYLIDRKVRVNYESKGESLTISTFLRLITSKTKLYDLLRYLRNKFKGDLFPFDDNEFDQVEQRHLDILYRLFKGDELTSGQFSLFNVYNFEIIPIEFISNIYEYFMGREKQLSQKAYYTPSFLVNYILDQTVTQFYSSNPREINCKVLDPTCGSGIFLVEALRRIVGQYEKINGKITNKDKLILKKLVTDNIFGIDKDSDAINVAMFSLYITLLDYQDPKDIEYFEFPDLLNKNFFVEDCFNFYEVTLFENERDENYATKLYNTSFNFVIGNPPWGVVEDSPYLDYVTKRGRKEGTTIQISDKQFSQAFLIRTSNFCSPQTVCSIVVNSKIFYNINAKSFRSYFLNNFYIDIILEMSPIRQNLFSRDDGAKGATAPAAVIFYRYANLAKTDNNEITHISTKHNIFYNVLKSLVIEKNDIKKLKQSNFINYDWIWKVLLYGNALDFHFIKRLRSEFPNTITSYFGQNDKFSVGVGVTVGGSDNNDASHLEGVPFLNLKEEYFLPFNISISRNSTWNKLSVHRPSNTELFSPPMLLVKKALTSQFNATSAVSLTPAVFTDNVIAVKAKNETDVDTLYFLQGIINSKLFTYFQINTASSIGVEREKAMKEELFSFPYTFDEEVCSISKEIQRELKNLKETVNLYKLLEGSGSIFISSEKAKEISYLFNILNEKIFEVYNLSAIEESLIDYARTVSTPLIHNNDEPLRPIKAQCIYSYFNVFNEHFSRIFNGRNGLYFNATASYNKYFVCISFLIEKEKRSFDDKSIIKDDSVALDFFTRFSLNKISEELYIQKDVKVFEKSSFYIIKPNEYKNWHTAIAYSDLFEIREALVNKASKIPATT